MAGVVVSLVVIPVAEWLLLVLYGVEGFASSVGAVFFQWIATGVLAMLFYVLFWKHDRHTRKKAEWRRK